MQTLRNALFDTLKDPEFLADAAKARLDIAPINGEDIEKEITALLKFARSGVSFP